MQYEIQNNELAVGYKENNDYYNDDIMDNYDDYDNYDYEEVY